MVDGLSPVLEYELAVDVPVGTVTPGVTVNPLSTPIDIIVVKVRRCDSVPCEIESECYSLF